MRRKYSGALPQVAMACKLALRSHTATGAGASRASAVDLGLSLQVNQATWKHRTFWELGGPEPP